MKSFFLFICLVLPIIASGATYYVDYATGSDANNGTTKLVPFKHAPGMKAATGLAASTPINSGDSIIFKGGVTWPINITGCFWLNYNFGPNQIYVGVDQTWFTGGSWSRPIFNGNGVNVGSCVVNGGSTTLHNVFVVVYGPHLTIDNIEFTGMLANATEESYFLDGSFGPDYFIISNNYFHGWSTAASSIALDPLKIFYRSPGYAVTSGVIDSNVVDGFDTPQVMADPTCTGLCQATGLFFYGFATEVKRNIVRYVSNGFIGNITNYHDNLTEYIRLSTNPSNHMNHFENNSDCNARIYNNVVRHWTSPSIVGLWVAPLFGCTDYVFNNVVYDTANANMYDMAPVEGCPAENPGPCTPPFGSIHSINNTVEAGPDTAGPTGQMGVAVAGHTAATGRNNHQVSSTTSYIGCPAANCTITTPVFQSKATANGQGYSISSTYPFSPTVGTGSTVGTGTNYTSLCAIDAHMANLCKDTTFGVSYNQTNHTSVYPGRIAVNRPVATAWDVGAYEYGGAPPPTPASPTGLRIIMIQ